METVIAISLLVMGFVAGWKLRQGAVDRYLRESNHCKYQIEGLRSKAEAKLREYESEKIRLQSILQENAATLAGCNSALAICRNENSKLESSIVEHRNFIEVLHAKAETQLTEFEAEKKTLQWELKMSDVKLYGAENERDKILAERNEMRSQFEKESNEMKGQLEKMCAFRTSVLDKIFVEAATLPSAVRWVNQLKQAADEIIVNELRERPNPAMRAAEQIKESRAKMRQHEMEAELFRNRLDLYEYQSPWLVEYAEYSLEEIIAGIKDEADLKKSYESGDDPVKIFLSAADCANLSVADRNQKALDRYWTTRSRSAWTAGIQYERYIGYLYEQKGHTVEYHGATKGKEDLGIDLICRKGNEVTIVQCKRLSPIKEKPVRENVVAQIYGASMFYAMRHGIQQSNVTPRIVTTYQLSEEAREFASILNVQYDEMKEFAPYPCIKCNISAAGERIYHLPFDQQYDNTIIDRAGGECYATTVAEAERQRFRRAFRWAGQN